MNTAHRDLSRFVAAPTILEQIACDAAVSPLFAASIRQVGNDRFREVCDLESVYCPDCNGSGEGLHDGSTCRHCGGSGEVMESVSDDEHAADVRRERDEAAE